MALRKIRESRLYRAEFGTFEEYCLSRWGMARQYANRLIGGAQVASNLVPMGTTPMTERVVRPLTRLDPDQQREVWTKANEKAASEDHLLAERQMGEFLKAMPKSKGGATYHPASSPRAPQTDSDESRLTTYKDVGVTRTQAFRAQKLADIPAPEFRSRIETAKTEGKLSTAAVQKHGGFWAIFVRRPIVF